MPKAQHCSDSGKLLRSIIGGVYVLCALTAVYPIIDALVNFKDNYFSFFLYQLGLKEPDNFWNRFVAGFNGMLMLYVLVAVAVVAFIYWNTRRKNLSEVRKINSPVAGLPLAADFIQNMGEFGAFMLICEPVCRKVFFYLACAVTNGQEFWTDWGVTKLFHADIQFYTETLIRAFAVLLIARAVAEAIRYLLKNNGEKVVEVVEPKEAPAACGLVKAFPFLAKVDGKILLFIGLGLLVIIPIVALIFAGVVTPESAEQAHLNLPFSGSYDLGFDY